MASTDRVKHCLRELAVFWPAPFTAEKDEPAFLIWVTAFAAELSDLSGDQLDRAVAHLRRHRRTRAFPLPGEIRDAVEKTRQKTTTTPTETDPAHELDLRCAGSWCGEAALREGWFTVWARQIEESGRFDELPEDRALWFCRGAIELARHTIDMAAAWSNRKPYQGVRFGMAQSIVLNGLMTRYGYNLAARRKFLPMWSNSNEPYSDPFADLPARIARHGGEVLAMDYDAPTW